METQQVYTKNQIQKPNISLPKGGGAIKSIGETFKPNSFSGTGSYSLPIPLSRARGFEPHLSINYNSGAGNSEYGLGFSLSLPKITIRTEKGIPKYDGNDVYIAGVGELVRKLKEPYENDNGFKVQEYLPRVEGSFSLIKHCVNEDKSESYWEVITIENEKFIFGKDSNSRISNPDNPTQIFEWLINESVDSKGNQIVYSYKEDNNEGTEHKIWEQNRSFNNKYIQNVKYGNYLEGGETQFAFEVVFNYGEYDISNLDKENKEPYKPSKNWDYRSDSFSSYKSGFEIRTRRLCYGILIFHHFENELGAPCLAKSVSLKYNNQNKYGDVEISCPTTISEAVLIGYRRKGLKATDYYDVQEMPPIEFQFSQFNPPKSPKFNRLEINDMAMPGYLNNSGFLPVDLNGEGISGLLYNDANSILYLEPKGDGKYSFPEAPEKFPIDKDFRNGQASLVDLAGNGELELIVRDATRNGFYQKKNDGNWENYQAFEAYPDDFSNQDIEMVGLSSNGKTDLLLTDEKDLIVYPSIGKKGYSVSERIQKEPDFPSIKKGYKKEYVSFSNMLGDGLSHRVKITNCNVECWPDMGYGKFGKKITLNNAPNFGTDYDTSRLFMADIDGSGTTDLIYVYPDKVELYLNQSGNSFSDAITVHLPEKYSDIDQISFSDVLGNGTTCLVFTKVAPVPVHYYYNFTGEIKLDSKLQDSMKPYLLNEIDNNLGSVIQIQYCSSTKFYLEDKKSDQAWITKLPFPVQVVEKIIQKDLISGSRYTSRYKYHDGYYDHDEKEFRGFGYVETWDSEDYDDFQKNSQNHDTNIKNIDKSNFVPPVYTRTWHHTGSSFTNSGVSNYYKQQYFQGDKHMCNFPDSVFDKAIYNGDVATLRQAYVAMSGHVIRTEVYSEDNSELSKNPYTVEESNVEVKLYQPRGENRYAVYLVNPRESISYHYERNPNDPRVQQKFSLDTDDFGNVLQSCNILLPRRADNITGATAFPEQLTIKATLEWHNYMIPLSGYLYCHDACEEQSLEINGIDLHGNMYFSLDEIKKQLLSIGLPNRDKIVLYDKPFSDRIQARQITWARHYFWNDEQTDALPLGNISTKALLHHSEQAVFTKDFTIDVFDGRLIDAAGYDNDKYLSNILYSKGGYFYDLASTYWWNKGLVQHYFLPNQPACFAMPYKTENTFAINTQEAEQKQDTSLCSRTSTGYDDYYLSPVTITEEIDEQTHNTVTAVIDCVTRQPKQLTDRNNNVTQALFDPLGQVIVTSIFGTENGVKTGGMTLYPNDETPVEYQLESVTSFDDILQNTQKYLQGANSYFYYDLNAWVLYKQPSRSVNLVAFNYYHPPHKDNSPYCQILVNYNDGLGRELEKKLFAGTQWQVSGRTVYNNKAKPFEQYLPYFSNTAVYEDQKDIPCPQPTVTHYDPLLRPVRIDTPKGFFSKVEFTPWEEVHFDEDDTVLDSEYYKSHYPSKLTKDEIDAIDKTIKFYNTPSIKHFDNTGSVFREDQNNLGTVSKNLFEKIKGITPQMSEEIWNELQTNDYLIKEDKQVTNTSGVATVSFCWLTDKFSPYTKGFQLKLDDKFKDQLEEITGLLKQNCLTSYYCTDILGRNTESIDPRLYYSNIKKGTDYYNFKYRYAINSGHKDEQGEITHTPVYTDSVDAGTQIHLSNIFGMQLWSWSARDYCQLINYDSLQRKIELKVKKITTPGSVSDYADFNLVEIFTYGETHPGADNKNLRGQIYQINDLSGIVINGQYSMQEQALEISRQLLKDYTNPVNWNSTTKPVMQPKTHQSSFTYNAVKHLITETTPDGSITTNIYNQAGELYSVSVEFKDQSKQLVVNKIEYDAKGQRKLILYGNGIGTSYAYEETTLRLISLKSKKPDNTTVQDISYFYDPAGNITRTYDNTYKSVFSNNSEIKPLSDYTYDALYRLISASGRQHQGINENTYKNVQKDNFKQSIFGSPPPTNDAEKLENYTETYTYDDSGNLILKEHSADVTPKWKKGTPVLDNSNRLEGYTYDESGNQRELFLTSTVDLSFNCCENLVKATFVKRPDNKDDANYYNYDSNEIRTRKINVKYANGTVTKSIEEKIYLGNYELKRNYSGDTEPKNLTFERQTLRIMDDKTCVLIIHYIKEDKQHPKKDKSRTCRFQMGNNLGSIALELDKNAKLISYEEYFPYGGTAIITGPNQAEVKLKEYRYSGKERDDSTGLYYYGARYYLAWLGRWLKPDPAGTVDGMNLYVFVGGNPVTHTDEDGKMKTTRSGHVYFQFQTQPIVLTNPFEWEVTTPVSFHSTNTGLTSILNNYGKPTTTVIQKYTDLANRISYDVSHNLQKSLSSTTITDLHQVFEASKPLHFQSNPLLGDDWRKTLDDYSGSKTMIPLYGHMRSKATAAWKQISVQGATLNDYLKLASGRPAEIHHILYKAIYPTYANQTSNLMLSMRSAKESVDGPGQHELMHKVASGNSSDKFNVILPQFSSEYVSWFGKTFGTPNLFVSQKR